MEISFKKLQPNQRDKYRQIRLESLKDFPDCFETTYKEALKLKEMFYDQHILSGNPRKFVMGAFDGDKLVGIAGFVDDTRYGIGNTGSVIQMYVKPAYSGNRISISLLREVEREAFKLSEIEQVMLEVNRNNNRAAKVYLEAGYTEMRGLEKENNLCLSVLNCDF